MTLSPTRIDLPHLEKFSTIAKLIGTLIEAFLLLIAGILTTLPIRPLLSPSLLPPVNLAWIFLFNLPIGQAKSLLKNGSIHNVQMLSNIKATTSNNGKFTKLRIQELYLYKLTTYAPKPPIMPKPPFSTALAIKLLHAKQDLAPCP